MEILDYLYFDISISISISNVFTFTTIYAIRAWVHVHVHVHVNADIDVDWKWTRDSGEVGMAVGYFRELENLGAWVRTSSFHLFAPSFRSSLVRFNLQNQR